MGRKLVKIKTAKLITKRDGYTSILRELTDLLNSARSASARSVNSIMTATYWQVGRRIVEIEQGGTDRAGYGEKLLDRLAVDLTERFGRGFSLRNLQYCRAFYTKWQISQTLSAELATGKNKNVSMETIAATFPLPWSHYVRLMTVDNDAARRFYETEALRGGWTIRQLDRQVSSAFYERTAASRSKLTMLTKNNRRRAGDRVMPDEQLKDPFLLEFLNLKDEYSESDVEEALIRHLESFLLELGSDFTFVGRQRRLRVGGTWYQIDLLFYHRRLRCLVIIDLKLGRFTHADAGQMHLYCNYAKEHWMLADENPPVGLILCNEHDTAVAHYALEGLPNKVMAARCRMQLPDEATLVSEIERTRQLIDSRARLRPRSL